MKTDVTLHIASEADLDALVRLAVAFRDHVGESTPSAQEFCASLVVLLHDASAEFFLASTHTGGSSRICTIEFISIKSWAAKGEDEPGMREGTAEVPRQIAAAYLP